MKESTKMLLRAIKSFKREIEYGYDDGYILTPSQKEEWKEYIRVAERCVIADIGIENYNQCKIKEYNEI